MSIATDESEKKYTLPDNHGTPVFDLYWLKDQQQKSYVAGRTAEPTEAEINEGRKAVCAALLETRQPQLAVLDGLTVREIQPYPCIVTLNDGTRIHVDRLVRLVLDAAREAVTE